MANSIGERLRELRKLKNKTLRQVGIETGLSYSGLAEIERNERSCNSETLKVLADYYGTSSDYLLGTIAVDRSQIKGIQLALSEGTKNLTDEQLVDILNYVDFVKQKK